MPGHIYIYIFWSYSLYIFFSVEVPVMFLLMCKSSLYVIDIISLSVLAITNVFFQSIICLLTLLKVSFVE